MSLWNYLLPPPNASAQGKAIDDLMIYIHLLMVVLFVGWLATIGCDWRFRLWRSVRVDLGREKQVAIQLCTGLD